MKKLLLAIMCTILGGIATFLYLGPTRRDTAPTSDRPVRFAMNVVVSTVPFWKESRETWDGFGRIFPNVRTVYGGPTDTDAQKQREELHALIAQGIDGLVIAPVDSSSLDSEIDGAVARGIPVLTYLVDAPKSKRATYVTSELEEAGVKIAKTVAAVVTGPGKVVVSYSAAGNEEQELRFAGIRRGIAGYSKLQLLQPVEDKYDENRGAEQISGILARESDVVLIMGCNSRSAIGAVAALKTRGKKPGEVIVAAWDADETTLRLIREGWIYATVAQNTQLMTQTLFGILASKAAANRGKDDNRMRSFHVPLPSRIVVPVEIITKRELTSP